jgi:phosphoribosylformylglycinamidine synthase
VATEERQLKLIDPELGNEPVDMPMEVCWASRRRCSAMYTTCRTISRHRPDRHGPGRSGQRAAAAVADKSFLITIGDRSVGGMTVRDQMVGPWQVPVADCAVTAMSFEATGRSHGHGRAHAAGRDRRAGLGPHGRGEAVTNIAAAPINDISDIKLSANWMAACGQPGQDAALYDTVKAVGMELCPALGISIPVGKDSLSMRTTWKDEGEARRDLAGVADRLLVRAGHDVRKSLTPQLRRTSATRPDPDRPGPRQAWAHRRWRK